MEEKEDKEEMEEKEVKEEKEEIEEKEEKEEMEEIASATNRLRVRSCMPWFMHPHALGQRLRFSVAFLEWPMDIRPRSFWNTSLMDHDDDSHLNRGGMRANGQTARVRLRRWRTRYGRYLLVVSISMIVALQIYVRMSKTSPERAAPESDPDVVIVSSTLVCQSGQGDCAMKEWIRPHSFRNWSRLGSRILILVDHQTDCDHLPEGALCQEHDCMHKKLGIPVVKCLIQTSMRQFPGSIIVFTNDDIMFQGLDETVRVLDKAFDAFVVVGHRTNVPLDRLDYPDHAPSVIDTQDLVRLGLKESTNLLELDYFVFKLDQSVFEKYPDFVLGNWRWDNVMVDYLLMYQNVTMIDASKSVKAYHIGKTSTRMINRKGAKYNDQLMKAYYANTDESVQYGGDLHPKLRFGSMKYAQYETTCLSDPLHGVSTHDHIRFLEKEKRYFIRRRA